MSRRLNINDAGRLTERRFLDDGRVAQALDLLNRDGEVARVVGGAVRNALLGLAPGDIDIATTASPQGVMAAAKAGRIRAVPTGIEHGTVTLVIRGLPLEVTTLREDVETDGRHAVVRFGRDFTEDARRRDFTINALSVDADGLVHDVTDGIADLAAGRVRFIGDAATRIREDYLRILRFFRFSASYATDALDPDGRAACAAGVEGLSRLSRERVRAELLKLLVAPRAPAIVDAMAEARVLVPVVGVPCWPKRHGRLAALDAAAARPPDPLRRLAALALGQRRDALLLRDRLRLSNDERDRLTAVADALALLDDAPRPPDEQTVLRLLHAAGRPAALDAVLIRAAEAAEGEQAAWHKASEWAGTAEVPSFPFSGADLLQRGLRAGPLVGAVLKDVQGRWIRAGFPADPTTLRRLLDEAVASTGGPPATL